MEAYYPGSPYRALRLGPYLIVPLLVRRGKRLFIDRDRWVLPGGRVMRGEAVERLAARHDWQSEPVVYHPALYRTATFGTNGMGRGTKIRHPGGRSAACA